MKQQTGDKPLPRTRSKTAIVFSRIASFVFHPLLMTAIMAIALYELGPDNFSDVSWQEFKKWIGKLFLFTVLFPLLSILLFKISGLISNARMHKSQGSYFSITCHHDLLFFSLWHFCF